MNKKLCIYHANCTDGFGSALIVRISLGEDNVDFYPGIYGQDPPDVRDRDVIIVDFSYRRKILIEMAKKAKSITILDHHISAEKDLEALEDEVYNIDVVFDQDKSGVGIVWDYYNPPEVMPQLFRHIQDRDLWKFELANTKEILAALNSYPFDFSIWEGLLYSPLNILFKEGLAIVRYNDNIIASLIANNVSRVTIKGSFDNFHNVPIVNCLPQFISDLGAKLSINEPFAIMYFQVGDKITFSLRSDKNSSKSLDVSEIATFYGGGGHKDAAGFTIENKCMGIQTIIISIALWALN